MKATKFVAAFALMLITAGTASAQTTQGERARIKSGVKSGELTKKETKTLVNQQKDIHQDRKEAKADGVVTKGERKDIKQDKRKASRSIYRKKHNGRVRH
ncbi:MAG: hypothetical protein ABIP30_05810 [Ferruginibacter sp.]